MRVAILGNSGFGKSMLARRLAAAASVPVLDLDSIVWEPNVIAVPRPGDRVLEELEKFCTAGDHWIIGAVTPTSSAHRSAGSPNWRTEHVDIRLRSSPTIPNRAQPFCSAGVPRRRAPARCRTGRGASGLDEGRGPRGPRARRTRTRARPSQRLPHCLFGRCGSPRLRAGTTTVGPALACGQGGCPESIVSFERTTFWQATGSGRIARQARRLLFRRSVSHCATSLFGN